MLVLDGVTGGYRHRRPWREAVRPVVCDVDLTIGRGEIVGLVGESASGKSTLARTVVGLNRPLSGRVWFEGADVHRLRGAHRRAYHRDVQMVFQDPLLSLSPRLPAGRAVEEALQIHGLGTRRTRRHRVGELLDLVGLARDVARRTPRELSGGQRQRVAVARALAVGPRLLICDEPVSALDVSSQATVLNLLADLRDELGLACLFIAHDLAVVCQLADRVAVLHSGRIVEEGPTSRLTAHPEHPHTKSLLAAAPRLAAIPAPEPPLSRRTP